MKSKVIIIGAFHEIIELVEEQGFTIFGLVDNIKSGDYRGYGIIHNDYDGSILSTKYSSIPIIISPDSPIIRHKLSVLYIEAGFKSINIISNTAKISTSSILSEGIIIQHGVNVSAESRIGGFVKLNTYCNVMHNSVVGEFSTVAPNAVILGNVKIGNRCYIGSNATILPNLTICEDAIIGAGAVVTKHISKPGKYSGVPAKLL